ncbi:MAG: helix-turn-helix domain-containing protein [Verrucomicrobia bacterium]|nr:helix-turn-helix domain-containing protein [Verrucomicrobiota bacterium]
MEEIVKIRERLRLLRSRHGLTQEEFAQIAGFNYKFYQSIEAGRKNRIWLETVERLASAYGLETWQLLGPEIPEKTKPKQVVPKSKVHYR